MQQPSSPRAAQIPTYGLYGEEQANTGEFWLHCETIAARSRLHNWEIKAHRHEALYQILLIEGGIGEAVLDGRVLAIPPPAIVTIPAGNVHGFRFSRDMDGLVFTLLAARMNTLLQGSYKAGRLLAGSHLMALDADDEDAAYLAATLRHIGRGYAEGAGGEHLDACIRVAIGLMGSLLGPESGIPDRTRAVQRMAQLADLMARHELEHRPVAFYANAIGVSTTHLNRIARLVHGVSVHDLLARRLAAAAKRELLFTDVPVQRVAYMLGFADPSYFNRFFQQQAGCTPGAYRRQQWSAVEAPRPPSATAPPGNC